MLDGSLFTRDFLAEGIMQEADWKHLSDAAAKAMAGKIEALLSRFPHSKKPNESQTEDDVVWPILAALGWSDHLRQQNLSARGRDDVPDGLLFPDADAKARANHEYEEWRRYEYGLAIVESKRWNAGSLEAVHFTKNPSAALAQSRANTTRAFKSCDIVAAPTRPTNFGRGTLG
jgi:hypothetical protein